MVTLLRDHVAVMRQAPFGHMVTQQRDHATRPNGIAYGFSHVLKSSPTSPRSL